MRAEVAILLAVLVAMPAHGLADDQPINVPAVPEPSCQCGPNGEWILCSSCPSGDAPASTAATQGQQQGVPPILKLAAGAIVVTVVIGMGAVAPGHTFALFGKSKSAKQAREAWDDERDRIAALERAYTDAVVLGADIERSVAAAKRPVRERVGAGYAAVELAPPPAIWSPTGACSEIVEANDRTLAEMDRRATNEARGQFPTWAGVVKKSKQEALAMVARAVGADRLLKQGQALKTDYERAKEMDAFFEELLRCQESKAVDPTSDCELEIVNRVNAELKVFMDELQAGAGDAHERVRKASLFYRGYVNDLRRAVEKQALWTARCQ